jgi:hypothetical protein
MELDVRLPMGVMFVLLGAVLVVTGLAANPEVNAKSLGINVNLWWGLVMAGLGAVMLLLAWRSRAKIRRGASDVKMADA